MHKRTPRYGVLFALGIAAWLATATGQSNRQRVESAVPEIQVVGLDVADQDLVLHLKNTSQLALVGIIVTRGENSVEESLAMQPSQKVPPQQAFDFTYPANADQQTKVNLTTVRAALFEDGSGSGNPDFVDEMSARLRGAEDQSKAIVQALQADDNVDRLFQTLTKAPGVPGHATSLTVPDTVSKNNRAQLAYASGYLGTKERALRELTRIKNHKGNHQTLAETGDIEQFRAYFDQVPQVLRARRAQ